MAAIISRVRLQLLTVPGASQYSKDQWAEQLKAKAERMNTNRKAKIANGDDFSAIMSGPAAEAYRSVLNPDFVSRRGLSAIQMTAKQASNMADAFNKYSDKLDFMFVEVEGVPAKRFKERVDLGKETWSEGVSKKTLPFTGSRQDFLGLSSLAGMWLIDDPRTELNLRGGDVVQIGGPKRICTEDSKSALRMVLNQRLIQSGASLIDQNWEQTTMDEENNKLNALVNGYRDPLLNIEQFTTGGDSHVNWILDTGTPYLEIQVAVTP